MRLISGRRNMKIFLVLAMIGGCGAKESIRVVEIEKPIPIPGDTIEPGPGTSWAEMRNLFNKNCESCHRNDPFAQNEQALRDSRAGSLIQSRKMPPNQNGFDADRVKMLNFF